MGSHDTPGKVKLRIEVPAGSVRIETRETDRTEIGIVPRRDDDASHRALDHVEEIVREVGAGDYEVRLKIPMEHKRWGIFQSEMEFDVRIIAPLDSDLEIVTISADVNGEGSFGEVRARSTSGDMNLEDVTGAGEFKTVSGDLQVGAVKSHVRAESVSGDITIESAGGELVGKSVSGDLKVGEIAAGARLTTVSGDVGVKAASSGALNMKTTSGDIEVGVAAGASVWMDVSSLSGETTSYLEPGDDGGGASLEVRASSLSGDVTLRPSSAVSA